MSSKIVPYLTQRYCKCSSSNTGKEDLKIGSKISLVTIGIVLSMTAIIGVATQATDNVPDTQYSKGDTFYSEMVFLENEKEVVINDSTHHPKLLDPEIKQVTMYNTQEIFMSAEKVSFSVPKAETGAKRWMDYRTITAKSSMQWKLQQDAWTDEYGFRRYGDYYMIAMGTYYAKQCGKLFEITLENGFTFLGLISDIKQDAHTDSMNQHRFGNVVEFIVDKYKIPSMAKRMGDMSYAFDTMNAKIASIKEINP